PRVVGRLALPPRLGKDHLAQRDLLVDGGGGEDREGFPGEEEKDQRDRSDGGRGDEGDDPARRSIDGLAPPKPRAGRIGRGGDGAARGRFQPAKAFPKRFARYAFHGFTHGWSDGGGSSPPSRRAAGPRGRGRTLETG